MFSIFGYWAANYYVKTERRLVKEINEIRADKGLPTLVGTQKYEWTSGPDREAFFHRQMC